MRERISEWEAKCKADAAAAANSTVQNSSLFSSVLDRTPLRQLAPASPAFRPPNQTRGIPPQRPANTNLQNTNSSSNQTSRTPNSTTPAGSPSVAPKPTFLSRVPPKTPNQAAQPKVVTSTQADDIEKISLEVSSFLDGLDTDLLFDEF